MAVLACFAGLGIVGTTLPRGVQAETFGVAARDSRSDRAPITAEWKIGFAPATKVTFSDGQRRYAQLPLTFAPKTPVSVDANAVRLNLFSGNDAKGFGAGPMLNMDIGSRVPTAFGVLDARKGPLLQRRSADHLLSGLFLKYAF